MTSRGYSSARLIAETISSLTVLVIGQGFSWDCDDLILDLIAATEAGAKHGSS